MTDSMTQLEEYLRFAPLIGISEPFKGGVTEYLYFVILAGGVETVAKPEDALPEGPRTIRSEAAAWVVARTLRWTDLMAATVLRGSGIPSMKTGKDINCSLQLAWPDFSEIDVWYEDYQDDDIWRAALFDVIVGQCDRKGHNWLALGGRYGKPRLKLLDNGFAFDAPHRSFRSTPYEKRENENIPERYLPALQRIIDGWDALSAELTELLAPGSRNAVPPVRDRTNHLLTVRRLEAVHVNR